MPDDVVDDWMLSSIGKKKAPDQGDQDGTATGPKDGKPEGMNAGQHEAPPAPARTRDPIDSFTLTARTGSFDAWLKIAELSRKHDAPRSPDRLVFILTGETKGLVKLQVPGLDSPIEGQVSEQRVSVPVTFAPDKPRAFRAIVAGQVIVLALGMDLDVWRDYADRLTARNAALGFDVPKKKPISRFPVPGGYFRPMHLSRQSDLSLLKDYHEAHSSLSWAVSLALFALTDPDVIRAGGWQEAKPQEIEDLVYQLTEDAPRRGQWRHDVLAEVVKLHKTNRPTIAIETVQKGRTWASVAKVNSIIPVPELQLEFINRQTGQLVRPTDPGMGKARTTKVFTKGHRGEQAPFVLDRFLGEGYRLAAIRWKYAPSLNDDLIRAPKLIEDGKMKGRPKLTSAGKVIRGYNIQVSQNIFDAMKTLRAEGRSVYAIRLLIMLAHNLRKTEDGIEADKVFRSIGIDERSDERPEDIVARAIARLKKEDIGALLPGSDELPRKDDNPDRRKGPYYRLLRSPEFIPPMTVLERQEEADAIGAEYEITPTIAAASAPGPTPKKKSAPAPEPDDQPNLPGMDPPITPDLTAADIRSARAASGLTIREWTRAIAAELPVGVKAPAHMTWHRMEAGVSGDRALRRLAPEVVAKVRELVARHRPAGTA